MKINNCPKCDANVHIIRAIKGEIAGLECFYCGYYLPSEGSVDKAVEQWNSIEPEQAKTWN